MPTHASQSCSSSQAPKVVFAGAGPGAPDLITLRGRRALDNADLVVYAGSLVNPELLAPCKKSCRFEDSSHMNLEEQVEVMTRAAWEGLNVVRLHSGDPSLYGAIREQIQGLERAGVSCEVIPGVTSAFAAAAALALEYTVPNVTQSLVFTRSRGRTPSCTPATKTTGNSSPLAAWRVISRTAPDSQPCPEARRRSASWPRISASHSWGKLS